MIGRPSSGPRIGTGVGDGLADGELDGEPRSGLGAADAEGMERATPLLALLEGGVDGLDESKPPAATPATPPITMTATTMATMDRRLIGRASGRGTAVRRVPG